MSARACAFIRGLWRCLRWKATAVQGGPVLVGSGGGGAGAGNAAVDALDASRARKRIARSKMSPSRLAPLPPWRTMTRYSSRHSGWFGTMPRSRQMSAMTTPSGRRRTWAAICSGVGSRARRGSAASLSLAAAGRRAWRTLGRRTRGPGWHVWAGGQRGDPGLERAGAQQALGDAREDQADVARTEGAGDEAEVGAGGALLEGGGEFLAVVDELADEAEEAAEAGGPIVAEHGGVGEEGLDGEVDPVGHERNRNTKLAGASRNFFWSE